MIDSKVVGYKKIFGFVLPDWVSEKLIKVVAFGILTLAVMLGVLFFVIMPQFDVIKEKTSLLKKQKESLTLLKKSREGLLAMNDILSNQDRMIILSAIPQQYSPDEAVYMLRKISADTGVSIVSYTLPSGVLLDSAASIVANKDGEMVGFDSHTISLTVSAPVESLLKFIYKIESSLPFGVVSDLNLQEVTKLTKKNIDQSVQMAMDIKFFQANLSKVNINKVQPFSEEDIKTVKELTLFNLFYVPAEDAAAAKVSNIATASGIFGF